ncbi:MAG: hypothetical protein B7Z11_04785 [Acidovorax sp. 32-64-7]|nr:MAG: hypothetical protein B7Z11_04785 [Acidovorax sp. 32-64-7]OYY27855.1 MAG: hypothetical protein B7Y64_10460 [Acidovorax sp. 35-64-16]OZA69027.1 MAG: hypothetical protein B7X70_12465 [Acidovorax sp. 39-64-12]
MTPTVFSDASHCIGDGISHYPKKFASIQILLWCGLEKQAGLHGALSLVLSYFCLEACDFAFSVLKLLLFGFQFFVELVNVSLHFC